MEIVATEVIGRGVFADVLWILCAVWVAVVLVSLIRSW